LSDDYLGHLREFRRVLQNLGGGASQPVTRGTLSSLTHKLESDETKINADQIERSLRQTVEDKRTIQELSNYEQDVMSVFQEVTSRKRHELERERFRKLLDQSSESILVVEPYTGRLLDMNDTATRMLGYSREELLELCLNNIEVGLPLVSSNQWHDWVEGLRKTPETTVLLGTHRKRDGTDLPVEASVGFATVDNEELLLVITRDATERRKSEKRIRRQWGFFSRVAQESLDGVWAFDRALNITYWNPAMERMLGVARDDVIGKNALHALQQLKDQGEDRFFNDALQGKTCTSRNRFYKNDDNGQQIYFEGYYTPLTEDGGEVTGAIAMLRDVTAKVENKSRHARESKKRVEQHRGAEIAMQKRYQREIDSLKKTNSRLLVDVAAAGESVDNDAPLSTFAGGVANAVEPLMADILSQTGAALSQLAPDSPVRRSVEEIEAAALHTNALALTLGSFSGNGKVRGPQVQLDTLIKDLEHSLCTVAGRDVQVSRATEDALPGVCADERLIRELLRELVTNASEAMDGEEGVVRVETGTTEVDKATLAKAHLGNELVPGHYVYIQISDAGSGMDQETLSKSFVPFFSTKEEHRGLGLATVLGVMRAHRGAVTIVSERDQGSSVRALFPMG